MTNLYLAGQGLAHSETTVDYPRPDRLVNGNPKRLTQSLYEHPNMNCGIWQCEVGAWNIVFANNKQEFFNIIEGIVRIHDAENNTFIEVKAGEAGVIPPSFKGTFEVVEAVKKYFVVVDA
ncbi:DUF861 domain-containing protein [Acinetobacter wuhouensis]|uniref:cupin domain-containing protein n=1 Tax=Acinetobacter wuhouensis TaxID=1879050 RepID=UPI00083A9A49|nr:cupin domain-containing protein [Acinetobacter wuhouensis]AXQ21953.1 DUF861 domain-containing protein [Acinetobacter wuhouensis]